MRKQGTLRLTPLVQKLQSLVYRITKYRSRSRSLTGAKITARSVAAAEDLTRRGVDTDRRGDKPRILPSGIQTNDPPMRINSLGGANCLAT